MHYVLSDNCDIKQTLGISMAALTMSMLNDKINRLPTGMKDIAHINILNIQVRLEITEINIHLKE